MAIRDLDQLAALLQDERAMLLARWREQVRRLPASKSLDAPTLDDHVPALLDELGTALRSVADETIPEALVQGSPPVHGLHRYQDGFDIVEVVAEYNILRGCIHDLAERHGLTVQGRAFHILNRVLDEAIGLAVQAFATQQALEVRRHREDHFRFVAHDLRTPLGAVSLCAQVLEHKLSAGRGAETAQTLQILQRNVKHLQSMVEDVLKESGTTVARGGVKVERRQVDVWPLVESVLDDLRPVAETAGTRLANQVPGTLTASADAGMLKRVLQNLVANAIKHTPRGEVSIGAAPAAQGGIECWVRDNGTGIPADQLKTILESDAGSAQREAAGGIGLSIVKTFVEAHGGTVNAESTEGAGSTFRFTLPAQPPG